MNDFSRADLDTLKAQRVSQAVWNLRTTCQPGGVGRYPQRSFSRVDDGDTTVGVGTVLVTIVRQCGRQPRSCATR